MARALLTRAAVSRHGLVVLFFVALAIANSYPLVLAPSTTIGHHGDAFFSVWRLAWVAHQLRSDPRHLFDANIYYPERRTLAYSDAMLLPATAVAPLHWIGLDPLLVYNLTLHAAFVLSALAAYALVLRLTGSRAAGVLGGLIFGFSPHRFEHFDHLELQFAFWIPLAALAWHRAARRDTPQAWLVVAGCAVGQILSSIYHGMFLLAWLAFIIAVEFLRTPTRAARTAAWVLVPGMIVLLLYSLPYFESRKVVGERTPTDVATYSAVPADFLSAPANNRLYGWTDSLGANERHLFPGVVAVLLLAVGLWHSPRPVRALYAAGLAFAIVLTLGFNGGLYWVLYEWVLPFRALRVPSRAAVFILLSMAVLCGFGLTWLLGRAERRGLKRLLAAVAIAATTAEYLAKPPMIEVDSRSSEWYAWLRTVPDAVVFEWPVTVPWRLHIMQDVVYMYRSTEHWRPLLNGYSGNYPRGYIELLLRMRNFPYTDALNYLRRRGATILVVHEQLGSRPTYQEALERLHREPGAQLIAQSHDAGSRVAFFRLLPQAGPPNRLQR